MGIYKNLDDAARSVELTKAYQPNLQNHETYSKYFAIFENLSIKLYDDFKEIAKLQQK